MPRRMRASSRVEYVLIRPECTNREVGPPVSLGRLIPRTVTLFEPSTNMHRAGLIADSSGISASLRLGLIQQML